MEDQFSAIHGNPDVIVATPGTTNQATKRSTSFHAKIPTFRPLSSRLHRNGTEA